MKSRDRVQSLTRNTTGRKPCDLIGRSLRSLLLGSIALLVPLAGHAQSLPQGGQFQGGTGTITYGPQQLQINQSSLRGIINWQNFNIGSGNTVAIDNGGGATLNRVLGGSPSSIFGSLSATGSVYLINPAGIVIGPGGSVVTGGSFVASTLDILNSDFMSGGPLKLQGNSTATVDNQGNILSSSGSAYLVGQSVQNEGSIAAPAGAAGLAGGQSVLVSLDEGGDGPTIFVEAGPGYFKNSGTIAAAQAELRAAGGNPLALSGENTGIVRATGTAVKDGHVWLTADNGDVATSGQISARNNDGSGGTISAQAKTGTLMVSGNVAADGSAPGTVGGDIELLGQLVGIFDNASVSASGPSGGGTVLVGGNLHGAGPQQTATATGITPTATIAADATISGNGGKVVVWGTEVNNDYGAISAKGGPQGGNGGMVEVSSIDGLNFAGTVDTSAANGSVGTLLLDPKFLIVANSGVPYSPGANNLFASNPSNTNTITPASIGASVANVVLQANTDLTVTNAVNMTLSGISLTMQAGRSVLINANVSTNNGGISITANESAAQSANRDVGAGNITMANGTKLNSGTADTSLTVDSTSSGVFTPGSMTLGGISANNLSLTVPGSGTITQSAAFTAPGTLTLNGGNGAITLTNANNDFGTATATTAGDVSLRDTNALNLGASSIGGAFDVRTAGSLLQSGALTVTGATTLAAGGANDITLNNANNNFSSVSITNGNNVTLMDLNALNLGSSTLSGALNVTTGGAITQSGAITATGGTTTLNAGTTNDITLTNASNNFATVAISNGHNVALTDTNALALGTSTVGGTLKVSIGGNLTQSGALAISGATTLTAGTNNVTLNNAGNDFSSVGIVSAKNVALTDAYALVLNQSVVTGTLGVTTSGDITQSGPLIVTGITTLDAGSTHDVLLSDAGNDFSTVAIANADNATLDDANDIILGASTVSGDLDIKTSGTITQSGALTVSGTASLIALPANDITLNNVNNDFATVAIGSGDNVSLRDSNALVLGQSTVSGTLNVRTAGDLTQSGKVIVVGPTTLAVGNANDITLTNAGNDFFSTVAITNADNVVLRDASALVLGASNVSGTFGVTTSGAITQSGTISANGGLTTLSAGAPNDITLTDANNNFQAVAITSGGNVQLVDTNALMLGNSTVNGSLDVTAGGNLTQVAASSLGVGGLTTLTAGTNNINLGNVGNDFTTVSIVSAKNVTLADTSALTLGPSTITGTLDVTTNGALTQSGALSVAGTTTLDVGSGNDITLDSFANDFSTVGIVSGDDVALKDANALDLDNSTISGKLNVTTNGAITQSGALSVSGTATLDAGSANDITLGNANNDFATIAVASGDNVSLRDKNALILGASTVNGTFDVHTAGTIAQSGALSITGLTTLNAGAANNIVLSSAGNDFSTVAITNANNVTLDDANALNLGASNINGTFDATTHGAITQTGAVSADGLTTLTPGAGNDITLDNVANNFSTVTIANGGDVTLINGSAMTINGFTVSGAILVATETGNLTKTGAIVSTAASGGDITLGAGISHPRGMASGGNVISTGGALTPSAGAQALVYTGSITNSTFTGFAPAAGSGDFRYNRQYGDAVGATGVGSGPVFVLYRRQPTVTIAPDAATKVYGTADPTFTFATAGLRNGDTPAQAGIDSTLITRQPGEDVVGSPYLFLTSTDLSALGYNLSVVNPGNKGLTITPATLTISGVTANNKVYDATTNATLDTTNAMLMGIVGSDNVMLDSTSAVGNFLDANVGGGKPVTASGFGLNGTSANNYTVIQPTGLTANITPATLTISAVTDSKMYNGNTHSNGVPTVAGLQGTTDSVTDRTQAFDSPHVMGPNGSTISVTGYTINDGNGGHNYTVVLEGATGTITPAPLHVAASANATKTFGTPDPVFGSAYYTVNLADLQGTDAAGVVTGSLGRAPGESTAGSPYLFNQGTLAASDYTIDFSNTGSFGLTIAVPAFADIATQLPPLSDITPQDEMQCDSGPAAYGAGCVAVQVDFTDFPKLTALPTKFIPADWASFD